MTSTTSGFLFANKWWRGALCSKAATTRDTVSFSFSSLFNEISPSSKYTVSSSRISHHESNKEGSYGWAKKGAISRWIHHLRHDDDGAYCLVLQTHAPCMPRVKGSPINWSTSLGAKRRYSNEQRTTGSFSILYDNGRSNHTNSVLKKNRGVGSTNEFAA